MNFKIVISTILIIATIALVYLLNTKDSDKPIVAMSKEKYQIQTRTIDSLQNVVDSLHAELDSQAKMTDSKEKKYKEILF